MTTNAIAEKTAKATFAAGCFWCIEKPFDNTDGVIKTTVGYTGGHTPNPTYKEVSGGASGHIEAIEVEYDPNKVTYTELLDIFWKNIDPTQADGQFCDMGKQYRSAIFTHNSKQKKLATTSREALDQSGVLKSKIVTELTPASTFYAAEDYHQDYYLKNPLRYNYYRYRCGRDQRLEELWGKN